MHVSHFVHPFIHRCTLELLPPLASVNNAATNVGVIPYFIFFFLRVAPVAQESSQARCQIGATAAGHATATATRDASCI